MLNALSQNTPFCLIKRRADTSVLLLTGKISALDKLDQISRHKGKPKSGMETFDSLSILPFRQVEELGFAANHGGEKILSLEVEDQKWIDIDRFLEMVAEVPVKLLPGASFHPDDSEYEKIAQRIIDEEIGGGEGCNFVIPRRFRGRVEGFNLKSALSCFKRLLENEYGSYWIFLYYTEEQYFIGATPERHLSCHKGVVKMNPISGTLRKMEYDKTSVFQGIYGFLKDQKEIFELLMVTDEELKMMAEICSSGGQVVGPLLKEMSKLIHTEYVLAGKSDRDVIDMLRQSMFAATVTGSPVENACHVIKKHDKESRRYYGSALALIGRDEDGRDTLDSPITIRMAEIGKDGNLEIGVAPTLVRDSVPKSETAETHAKAAGILAALGFSEKQGEPAYRLGGDLFNEDVLIALASRNSRLSRFWIEEQDQSYTPNPALHGKKVTIIDNEDSFTRMLAHIIRAQGLVPKIVRHNKYSIEKDDADLVVLGPGPGDPRNQTDEKMARASGFCREFLKNKKPLLCVCLGHQILCHELGLRLAKKKKPLQGIQETINLWGTKETVGFYNTFTGMMDDKHPELEFSFEETTGEIHAVRGAHFVGVQFHPESILTTHGFKIVSDILGRLLL